VNSLPRSQGHCRIVRSNKGWGGTGHPYGAAGTTNSLQSLNFWSGLGIGPSIQDAGHWGLMTFYRRWDSSGPFTIAVESHRGWRAIGAVAGQGDFRGPATPGRFSAENDRQTCGLPAGAFELSMGRGMARGPPILGLKKTKNGRIGPTAPAGQCGRQPPG